MNVHFAFFVCGLTHSGIGTTDLCLFRFIRPCLTLILPLLHSQNSKKQTPRSTPKCLRSLSCRPPWTSPSPVAQEPSDHVWQRTGWAVGCCWYPGGKVISVTFAANWSTPEGGPMTCAAISWRSERRAGCRRGLKRTDL